MAREDIMAAKSAYSLIELSIVILIIALIVSGITYGTSMIDQARLRGLITESDTFFNSTQMFADKYQAMPGDFPNAFAIWGATCASTANSCNGDGDGYVRYSTRSESFMAWKHMVLAGFLQGSYTGTTTITGQADIGVNVPQSSFGPRIGWSLNYTENYNPPSGYGQYFEVGAFTASNLPTTAFLTPQDAMNIDTKLDDGSPNSGLVMARGLASATGCMSSSSISATYNTTLKNPLCTLRFVFKKT